MKEVIRICIFGVLLVLIGCRSESVVETDELHQENMKKIVFFENYEKGNIVTYEQEDLNYADYSNPAIPFAQSVKYFLYQNSQIKKNIERKFGEVDFTKSTQVFRNEETGDKMVCFPIMKNGLIVHLLSVVVNKEYSYFYFRAMKGDESDFFNDVLTSFKKRRMFYNMKESLLSNEGDNRVNGYIGEVVIIKYNGLRRPHMEIVWSWGRDGNDGSGGGSSMGMGFPTGEGDGGGGSPSGINNSDFILNPNDAKKYPKFDKTVRNIKNYVSSNKKVKETLIKYTGLSEKELLNKLEYGKGPLVKVTKLPDAYGYHNPFTNKVLINEKYVSRLERAENSSAEVLNLFLSIVLLHEFVHWTDGLVFNYFQENGENWERETYGVVVNHNNIIELIKK